MNTVRQDFEYCFSHENLKKIYQESIKLSRVTGADNVSSDVFDKNLVENLTLIERKVLAGNYRFTRYKEKLISKGARSLPRIVYIPTIRDRITLKALNQFLQYRLGKKIEQSIPQNVTKDIKKGLSSESYNWVIKLDISNFYPSIRHRVLRQRLRRFIREENILSLIEKSLTRVNEHKVSGIGVPQGLSISNILAAIYLRNIDLRMQSKSSVFYRRYVDDIFILCNKEDSSSIISEINTYCRASGLSVYTPEENPEKSSSCAIDSLFQYVGYVYGPGDYRSRKITARKSSKQKLIDSLTGIFTAYKTSRNKSAALLKWKLDLRITGCISENKGKGWLFFFSEINDINLLHELDAIVDRLCQRYDVSINQKKFVRAWHEIKFNRWRNNYFPNFDSYNPDSMRELIALHKGCKVEELDLDNTETYKKFFSIIQREIRALESDIQSFS